MGQRQKIEKQIADLQRKLSVLNRVPDDTFNLGTAVVFSADSNRKHWYYVKVAEETWRNLLDGAEKDLASWILDSQDSNIGYFEVYELKVQPSPFYASA